jgi:uncharacterized cupin superfamily protein
VTEEARLEDVGSGLAPVSPGWFVVNAGAAPRVLGQRPGVEPQRFADTGITLAVLLPGLPSGLYHVESAQEDFLVLAGTCLLLIEEEERPLRAWDFVHCPSGTRHSFAGTGDEPCVILMIGARRAGKTIAYPVSGTAQRHGGGVDTETESAAEAYAPYPAWRLGRPPAWAQLPWG